MDAKSESLKPNLDITKCSICLETFKEPKVLPCMHTFCLHCLQALCKDIDPGAELPCPLCRKVFSFPVGGMQVLQPNVFMNQLLQVNQTEMSAVEAINEVRICEWCSNSECKTTASAFCIDCDQHICDRCSLVHRNQKMSKSHRIVDVTDVPNTADRIKMAASYCEEHPKEEIKLYCYDCKTVTCMMCYVKNHNKHECTDVKDAAVKYSEQLNIDIKRVKLVAERSQKEIKKMGIDKVSFMKKIADTQHNISQKSEELIEQIRFHQSTLIEKLNVFKNTQLKKMDTHKDEVERQVVIMESFARYCQEIKEKGTACNISSAANDLHVRAEKLVKSQVVHQSDSLCDFSFAPSVPIDDNTVNMVGELTITDTEPILNDKDFKVTSSLLNDTTSHNVFSAKGKICGITVLGRKLLVMRNYPSGIGVYASHNFQFEQSIVHSNSSKLLALVGCKQLNCIYVSDVNKVITRYNHQSKSCMNKWSADNVCYGLSVTKKTNVLVTQFSVGSIAEYTHKGQLVRSIALNQSMRFPIQCFELSNDQFIISHDNCQDNMHGVCIVDNNGRVIHSYINPIGSGCRSIHVPISIAVDTNGDVMIADHSNSIVLLSPTLTRIGCLKINKQNLNRSSVLHLDEECRRLFVGTDERICYFKS